MRRRIVILVGGLALLVGAWVVSWERYQDHQQSSDKAQESEEKATEKPVRFKRLPATKKKLQRPRVGGPVPFSLKEVAIRNFKGAQVSPQKSFTSGQAKFSYVENLKIVNADQRGQYEDTEVVEEKFNKLIVKGLPSGEDEARVVQNQRTKRLGILTGVFKIKLRDHNNWTGLAEEHSLNLEANFPGIRLSLLKTSDMSKVEAILSSLSKDTRIERVELEILEDPPQAK